MQESGASHCDRSGSHAVLHQELGSISHVISSLLTILPFIFKMGSGQLYYPHQIHKTDGGMSVMKANRAWYSLGFLNLSKTDIGVQ